MYIPNNQHDKIEELVDEYDAYDSLLPPRRRHVNACMVGDINAYLNGRPHLNDPHYAVVCQKFPKDGKDSIIHTINLNLKSCSLIFFK